MSLTYGGNLGIGKTNPTEKLHVAGSIYGSSGITINSGGASIKGDLTVTTGNISCTGTGNSVTAKSLYILDGASGLYDGAGNTLIGGANNVNITSGLSTYYDLNVGGGLRVSNTGVKISTLESTDNPLAPLQVGLGTEAPENTVIVNAGSIGIGTTAVRPDTQLDCLEGNAIFSRVGIGTTIDSNELGEGDLQAGNIIGNIVQATGGFTSNGSSYATKITVSGTTLTFTVDGVGSASLTLS
tara:strand:- start:118 stop:840 length:723 start_codon:yes stop_codon:yes gene_type:complete